jgi:hypothetical protein
MLWRKQVTFVTIKIVPMKVDQTGKTVDNRLFGTERGERDVFHPIHFWTN